MFLLITHLLGMLLLGFTALSDQKQEANRRQHGCGELE